MEKDMQDVINEIPENKIKVKKVNKNLEKLEKNYIKSLIFQEKSKNPSISTFELSNKFGISKDEVEKYLEELQEEKKKESEEKNKPKKPSKLKKIGEKINKIKDSTKKTIDVEDKKTLKEILLKIILYGIPLNFSLFVIFGIKFNLYSWVAWGYSFWFIKKELVKLLRSLWYK